MVLLPVGAKDLAILQNINVTPLAHTQLLDVTGILSAELKKPGA
jgi:hypothetical protein